LDFGYLVDRQKIIKKFRHNLYKKKESYPEIIVNTLNFNDYGRHFFSLTCTLNLLFEKKYEAVYDPMDRKWIIFDEESGKRYDKSIGMIFRNFKAECKKRRR